MITFIEKHPQPVQATILLFRQFKAQVSKTTISNVLQQHPNYPSILSISETLNYWNVENVILNTSVEKLKELPLPFITLLKGNENIFITVTQVSDSYVSYYSQINKKLITQEHNKFITLWKPVVLLAEPDKPIIEKNFSLIKRKEFFKKIKVSTIIFATLALILASLFYKFYVGNINYNTLTSSFYLIIIKILGVIVTSFLLWYEIDKNNPLLKQICTAGTKTNCNAILSGKNAKILGISWSEIGFFYFSTGLLILLVGSNLPIILNLLAWVNLVVIPYTIFSVYYQWKVAKQWCVLCLAVQFLLIVELIVSLFTKQLISFNNDELIPILLNAQILVSLILPMLVWYFIKPSLLAVQEVKQIKRELNRLKYDSHIFNTILQKQKQITVSTNGLGICLGNIEASHTIIKVCNPYCGPCAKAHPELEDLMRNNPNVKIQIIFTTTNGENNLAQKPAKHLLAIAENSDSNIIHQAFDDWYLADKKDYNQFAKKYPLENTLNNQNQKLENMSQWCKAMQIDFTPTIFINGYQMPHVYTVADLKYLLA